MTPRAQRVIEKGAEAVWSAAQENESTWHELTRLWPEKAATYRAMSQAALLAALTELRTEYDAILLDGLIEELKT